MKALVIVPSQELSIQAASQIKVQREREREREREGERKWRDGKRMENKEKGRK